MAWFKKERPENAAPEAPPKKVKIPEGLWVKCDNCKEIIYRKEVDKNFKVCPKCDYHFRISASERLPYLVDEGSFLEVEDGLSPKDFLGFKDYKDKLKSSRKKTGLKDAVISGEAKIGGRPVSLVIMDFITTTTTSATPSSFSFSQTASPSRTVSGESTPTVSITQNSPSAGKAGSPLGTSVFGS